MNYNIIHFTQHTFLKPFTKTGELATITVKDLRKPKPLNLKTGQGNNHSELYYRSPLTAYNSLLSYSTLKATK